MRGVEDGTPGAADALIGDLRAPVDGPVPAGKRPARPRHRPLLAVAGILALTGAAYSATAAVPPSVGPSAPGMPARHADAGPAVPGGVGVPPDVCSVHPGACPSPPGAGPDGTARFLPDELTGTTGSVIICEPSTGACRPLGRPSTDGDAPRTRQLPADEEPGVPDHGESHAYRTVPPGQLELMGVRLPDGAVVPDEP